MKEKIELELKKILPSLIPEDQDIALDIPQDLEHGDYSSNIALRLSKILKRNPMEIAEEIKSKLEQVCQDKALTIEKINIEKPGFINFWILKEELLANLEKINQEKNNFGKSAKKKGKKVMVEFTDPNPFKEFHIGHLYSNTVGESLSRLFESQGAEVRRVCYQGDVGLHVAKALWGILKLEKEGQLIPVGSDYSISQKATYLGKAYTFGAQVYEENEVYKKEINDLNKQLYFEIEEIENKSSDYFEKNKGIYGYWIEGKETSLEYFESIYQRLGTKFERYYFESQVGKTGLEYVRENIGKVFEESDGAIIFPGEKYGLHNRVFINSLGLPTYEAKELGLAPTKYKDFPYDESLIITGNEINEYFKVLLKALSLIFPELASKTRHISHGMVRLPEGKMSSRTGNVITGEWLLATAKQKIKDRYSGMDDESLEIVTLGAVKYALLKNGIGQDIKFGFEESISFDGNSGPYLQYTYVRTKSILDKLEAQNPNSENLKIPASSLEKEELELLRMLLHFPEVIESSAERYAPNLLCTYLFTLAQKFNLFYQKHSILEPSQVLHGTEDGNNTIRNFRVALTSSTGQVLKNGLQILGIKTPGIM